MKILLISNVYPPGFIGGYELGAWEIAQDLIRRGHEIQVLTSDYFTDEAGQIAEMEVVRNLECVNFSAETVTQESALRRGTYLHQPNLRKIGSAIRSWQPDVIMMFNLIGLGALGLVQFALNCGCPTLLYLMDNVFAGVDRASFQWRHYASIMGPLSVCPGLRVIAMSRNVMHEVINTLGIAPPDVVYVPGWVDETVMIPDVAPLDADHVRFVFSSRIAGHKGIDLVLDGAEDVVRAGASGFSVDMYGQGQVAHLVQSIRARGLDKFVHYKGSLPKIEMLCKFREYDALLLPTWEREPFGFVVGEAAAAGCFPIMTAGIGASEWFIDDLDCYKIERNRRSIGWAMLRTVLMPPAERLRLRKAALRCAKLNLGFSRWMNVIERQCLDIASQSQTGTRDLKGIQSAFLYLGRLWHEAVIRDGG